MKNQDRNDDHRDTGRSPWTPSACRPSAASTRALPARGGGRPWWRSRRALGGATLCVTCLFVAAIYVVSAMGPAARRLESAAQSAPGVDGRDATASGTLRQPPYVLFRSTALGDTYGTMGLVPVDTPDGSRASLRLRCERVHFAAGRGVCLIAHRGLLTTYEAAIVGADFQPRYTLPLRGTPSRVRVSPDGRFAAMTVFVSGHSYAAASFSTLTTVVDLHSVESVVNDMEKFTIWREGERFQAVDVNVWGVTFAADSNRFYATLGSGGRTYLIEGHLAAREAWVRREGIECPSLSPDNTRLAFKKRVDGVWGPVIWRLSVLDLGTLDEWALAETRSVDDQAEWLDDRQILYSLSDRTSGTAETTIWVVAADGGGAPRRFVPKADSPVVVRP
jgi:hypothetical protein